MPKSSGIHMKHDVKLTHSGSHKLLFDLCCLVLTWKGEMFGRRVDDARTHAPSVTRTHPFLTCTSMVR